MIAPALGGVPWLLSSPGQEPAATLLQAPAADAARAFSEAGLEATLIYIDPPFAANRDFMAQPPAGGERLAYSDKWASFEDYMVFMREVLEGCHALLSEQGSLLLHCDHRAAPYLAIACDEIFGRGDRSERKNAPGFRNELIWSYGLGGSSPRCYPKKHDTIFWYTKGTEWFFVPPRVPATSQRMAGQTKKAPDVLQVPTLNNMAKERVGYPTQKPLALLELLVAAHSEPEDLVVDLFSGSGTTATAAARLGRRVAVADIGDDALAVTAARLRQAGRAAHIYGRPSVREAMPRWELTNEGTQLQLECK